MGLPGADLNPTQKSRKKKLKNFQFLIFILVSNLPQDSLHFPLLIILNISFFKYFFFFNIFEICLG